jgi:membrane protease YdiL (CAAX protease family)
MRAAGTVCPLQLLNRIQRKMAAQSSVAVAATVVVLAAGIVSGVAGSCAVVIFAAIARKPPALHDPPLSWAVMTVTVAPVVEELLFRDAMLTGLLYILGTLRIRSDLNVFLGILFAALAFGFGHPGRTGAPLLATILTGMVYGWLRVRSGSAAVAAAAHSVYNLVLQFFPLRATEISQTSQACAQCAIALTATRVQLRPCRTTTVSCGISRFTTGGPMRNTIGTRLEYWKVGFGLATLVLLCVGTAVAQTTYTVTDLGTLGGTFSVALTH